MINYIKSLPIFLLSPFYIAFYYLRKMLGLLPKKEYIGPYCPISYFNKGIRPSTPRVYVKSNGKRTKCYSHPEDVQSLLHYIVKK